MSCSDLYLCDKQTQGCAFQIDGENTNWELARRRLLMQREQKREKE